METKGLIFFCLLPHFLHLCRSFEADELVIVVLDQENDNSSKTLLAEFISELDRQAIQNRPHVLTVSKNFSGHVGAWAVSPLIQKLAEIESKASWFFFCLPSTRLNWPKLSELLSGRDHEALLWTGYGLHDREPTIIHHFSLLTKDKENFLYPLFSSGFLMSQGLVSSLAARWGKNGTALVEQHSSEFSIDPSHELAVLVWDKGQGPTLHHSAKFCLAQGPNCVSYPRRADPCRPLVLADEIFFAVKTCGKFHESRVPVVLDTWAKNTKHFALFTDTPDPSIPGLVDLKVPNTEHGHCGKTEAIIKYVSEKMKENTKLDWLLIADDDTILSVERLQEFLSCHGPIETPLALGERYGFRVLEPNVGYSYLTGGGGVVLNSAAVHILSEGCHCPANDFPDDMYIFGLCLSKLHIPTIHSSLFHQARPDDYAPEYLAMQQPVSFHKHWLIDPFQVYKNWFDPDFETTKQKNVHIEL